MAQIRQVVSEALQAQLRALLPSQQGFTEDLQASNVITPIIDLTPTAEGSVLGTNLQTAMAFGSITSFACNNNTVTLMNTAGFWRIFGTMTYLTPGGGSPHSGELRLTDGTTTKTVFDMVCNPGVNNHISENYDFVIFLASGESASAFSSSAAVHFNGSYRQIADVNGNLVNPSGFSAS